MSLIEFIQQDRQWPHHLRITHAKRQLEDHPEECEFWLAVLRANGVNA